jgi:O-antigen ligase
MKSINEYIAASAVIIFPASVLVVDKVYGAVFLIVILLGMWQMVTYRKEIFPISKDEKLFFFSLCFVMVTVVITTVVNDTDMARADRFLALVLAIPAYYFFKRNLFDEKYIWIGLILGALIAAGTAIYQVTGLTYCPIKPVRAHGAVHQIIFGDLALLMGVMSLASIGWFWQRKQWFILIPVLTFLAGIFASVLSLTRGGWVALPFLVLVFLGYTSKRLNSKVKAFSFSLLLFLIVSIYLIPLSGVKNRIDNSWVNIQSYVESQDVKDAARKTSFGSRLEMWKTAWLIFLENPVVGVGWGNYIIDADELVKKGIVGKDVAKYSHPHNQFMSALSKGGGLGFISIVVLYLLPMLIFYKVLSGDTKPMNDRLALAGLLLLVAFLCFSLTEAILERSRSIIFFSFYLAVYMAFNKISHFTKLDALR